MNDESGVSREKEEGLAREQIELTTEAQQILDDMRELTEQIGGGIAAGLIDPEDDDARLADLFSRFDSLVLSWILP